MAVRAALVGVVAGTLFLGVGGRLLMRGIALATGGSGGFSLGGSLEVVLVGALYGGFGGLLYLTLPARLGRGRPPLHAAALLLIATLTSTAARGAASGIPPVTRALVVLAFGALFLGYSYALAAWMRDPRPEPRS